MSKTASQKKRKKFQVTKNGVPIIALCETFGARKAVYHFDEAVRTEKSQNDIHKLRAKFGIDPDGFPTSDTFVNWLLNESPKNIKLHQTLHRELRKYAHNNNLCPLMEPNDSLVSIMFYFGCPNTLHDYEHTFQIGSVCKNFDESENKRKDDLSEFSTHPISIKIHPQASIDDIIDHVRLTYSTDIKPRQLRFQQRKEFKPISIGKIRKISNIKRDDLILKHKEKSYRKVCEILRAEHMEPIDPSQFRRIISSHK